MNGAVKLNDAFVAAFGSPDDARPPVQFNAPFLQETWLLRQQRTGAGWFLGRFFYLLGEGLERLTPCLDAWGFLLPAASERRVIGYNAYGALLVMDDELESGIVAPVRLLNPTNLVCWADEECVYTTLLSRWLPDRQLPGFFDMSVYEQWLRHSGRLLEDDEILGIRTPLPLGGSMTLDNFSAMNIIDYYRATGPVYAKAFEQSKKDA